MFIKQTFSFLLLSLLTTNTLFCQKIFRNGYIIKNNGEILNGLIEYKYNQDIPSICLFKRFDIATQIPYNPDEIKGFGYINGNRYESRNIEGKDSFYEVLVSGSITLYWKGSKFFLEKGQSGLVKLNETFIIMSEDGQERNFDSLSFFLKYITEGKLGNIKEKINQKKDLVPIVADFNKASGSSYIVYNQKFTETTIISESFKSSANRDRFGILNGMNIYLLNISSKFDYFLPDPSPEISYTAGLTYERAVSRKNDKLALRIDMMFLKQNFYSYSEQDLKTVIYRDNAFFDFTGIKFPIMVQYYFKSVKLVPYLNAGVSYLAIIQKSYFHIRETENEYHEINRREDNNMLFNPVEFSWIFGSGIRFRLVNNIKINIEGRIELGKGLFGDDLSRMTFKQSSIQPNFLIGITF